MDAVIERNPGRANAIRQFELGGQFFLESVQHGTSEIREEFSSQIGFLMGLFVLLLVVLAANVGNLMLFRVTEAYGAFRIRMALGMTRWGAARIVLSESLFLGTAASLVGFALCVFLLPMLPQMLPQITRSDATIMRSSLALEVNWRVGAFIVVAGVVLTLLASLPAAGLAARASLSACTSSSRVTPSLRGRIGLMTMQLSACSVFLVCLSVLWQSLANLRSLDPGVLADRLVMVEWEPVLMDDTGPAAIRSLLLDLEETGGVSQVGLGLRPLMRGIGIRTTIVPAGELADSEDFMNVSIQAASSTYFDTVGLDFLEGRTFRTDDVSWRSGSDRGPVAVVVNQSMAELLFSGEPVIGQEIGVSANERADPGFRIVGVVTNSKYRTLLEESPPIMYPLLSDQDSRFAVAFVRTAVQPAPIIRELVSSLRSKHPELPIRGISTLSENIENSLWKEILVVRIAVILGIVSLAVAAFGASSLLSLHISSNLYELGIRKALGARTLAIASWLSKQILFFTAVGIAIGCIVSFFVVMAISSLVFSVSSADGFSYLVPVCTLGGMAMLIVWLRLRRIAVVEPAELLRSTSG